MTRRLLVALTLAALALPSGAAAADCTSDLPVSDRRAAHHECTGVHPGMGLKVPSKKYGTTHCTAAFAFADQFGNRYLTMPGICHLDFDCLEDVVMDELAQLIDETLLPVPTCLGMSESEEEPVYKRNGPVVTDFAGNRVGAIVYAVNKDEVNFALVKVDAKVKLDPQLPLWGGPTSATASPGAFVEEAYAYSAPSLPAKPNARTGLLHRSGARTHLVNDFGLSFGTGTPVMKPDGSAVGYYSGSFYVPLGWHVLTYADPLKRATDRTGLRLRMLLAPLR